MVTGRPTPNWLHSCPEQFRWRIGQFYLKLVVLNTLVYILMIKVKNLLLLENIKIEYKWCGLICGTVMMLCYLNIVIMELVFHVCCLIWYIINLFIASMNSLPASLFFNKYDLNPMRVSQVKNIKKARSIEKWLSASEIFYCNHLLSILIL